MIEAGELSGVRISDALEEILMPLENVEALLLACTHYPAITKESPALCRAHSFLILPRKSRRMF